MGSRTVLLVAMLLLAIAGCDEDESVTQFIPDPPVRVEAPFDVIIPGEKAVWIYLRNQSGEQLQPGSDFTAVVSHPWLEALFSAGSVRPGRDFLLVIKEDPDHPDTPTHAGTYPASVQLYLEDELLDDVGVRVVIPDPDTPYVVWPEEVVLRGGDGNGGVMWFNNTAETIPGAPIRVVDAPWLSIATNDAAIEPRDTQGLGLMLSSSAGTGDRGTYYGRIEFLHQDDVVASVSVTWHND